MQIAIALRGFPDYAGGRALVRERQRPCFAADATAQPDCFVVARRSRDAESTWSACAGLTFANRAPLMSERRLGRPIEAVIAAREQRAVERCTIVEIDAVASNDPASANELVRALPLLAWCLGREYVFCEPTLRLRDTFDRMGRFVVLRADRKTAGPSADHRCHSEPSGLGYGRTTSLTTNDDSGGHYCFDDIAIPVSPAGT